MMRGEITGSDALRLATEGVHSEGPQTINFMVAAVLLLSAHFSFAEDAFKKNHINWLKSEIGSYEADLTEIRLLTSK